MEKVIYSASLDSTAKIITGIIVILFAYVIYESSRVLMASISEISFVIHSATILVLLSTLIITYLLKPSQYEITDNAILIIRPFGPVEIKVDDIENVEIMPIKGVTIRTWASGGLFGYLGKFRNSKIGPMTFYNTRRNNKLLITLKQGKKIVITPDSIELLDKLKSII